MFLSANSRLTGGVAARRNFPAGTQLMFINAAAPIGWTRVTTFDDALLRIVGSAVPGSGGSNNFTAVNAQTATGSGSTGTGTTGGGTTGGGTSGNFTITNNEMPSHTHDIGCNGSGVNTASPSFTAAGVTFGAAQADRGASFSTGSGNPHNHSIPGLSIPGLSIPSLSVPGQPITFAIKYVDALIARKS